MKAKNKIKKKKDSDREITMKSEKKKEKEKKSDYREIGRALHAKNPFHSAGSLFTDESAVENQFG